MTSSNSHSLLAAGQFLQTVVVVDDSAYDNPEKAGGVASLGMEVPLDGPDEVAEAIDFMEDLDPEAFDTEIVVDGFADLGMHCAVLAPGFDESDEHQIRLSKLARRADVVVLDWVIRSSEATGIAGDRVALETRTTLPLLLDIIRQDAEVGARLRLICIYTGKGDAESVLLEVDRELNKLGETVRPDEGHLVLDFGGTRIVVLRKERKHPIPGNEEIKSAELPSRVVEEFARFAVGGFLPEMAVLSLSAVRDQAHMLLRRFSQELDPALLSHRSTTSSTVAEQYALDLIGDELSAISSMTTRSMTLADERVEPYLQTTFGGRKEAHYRKSSSSTATVPIEMAKRMILAGDGDRQGMPSSNYSRSALFFRGGKEEASASGYKVDLKFSALSSLSRDGALQARRGRIPSLKLGAIISSAPQAELIKGQFVVEHGTQYWLCIQPVCDSVRLDRLSSFPLLPLRLSKTPEKFDVVVHSGDGYLTLDCGVMKMGALRLANFMPDFEAEEVLASRSVDHWLFEDDQCRAYRWLGDMRLDRAHKMLHALVTAAGRIGIDEYDYLRNASTLGKR